MCNFDCQSYIYAVDSFPQGSVAAVRTWGG